jgi:hypothetical protein
MMTMAMTTTMMVRVTILCDGVGCWGMTPLPDATILGLSPERWSANVVLVWSSVTCCSRRRTRGSSGESVWRFEQIQKIQFETFFES